MLRRILLTIGSVILVIMLLAACASTPPTKRIITPTAQPQVASAAPTSEAVTNFGPGNPCPADSSKGLTPGPNKSTQTISFETVEMTYACVDGVWTVQVKQEIVQSGTSDVTRISAKAASQKRCPDITVSGVPFESAGNTFLTTITARQGPQYVCGQWYKKVGSGWNPELRWLSWELTPYAAVNGTKGNLQGLETVEVNGVIHLTGRLSNGSNQPWLMEHLYDWESYSEEDANVHIPVSVVEAGQLPVIMIKAEGGWYALPVGAQKCENLYVNPSKGVISSNTYGISTIPYTTGNVQFAIACSDKESTPWLFVGDNDRVSYDPYSLSVPARKLTSGTELCPGQTICMFVWDSGGVLKVAVMPLQLTDQNVQAQVGPNAQFWSMRLSDLTNAGQLVYALRIGAGNTDAEYIYPTCTISTHLGQVTADSCPK